MANRDSENSVLTREQVLALDIATHTGYFSLHEAGTWNFTESKRRNGNKMHGAFRTTLLSLLRRYGIRRVVAEDVSVNRHFYDMRRLSELRGTGVRQPGCPQEMGDGRRTRHQDADGRGLQGQIRYCPGG